VTLAPPAGSADPQDAQAGAADPRDASAAATGLQDAAAGPAGSLLGAGLVVAAAVLFAVNGTVSKLVLQSGLSAQHLVEIRCVGAALLLAAFALARDPGSLRVGPRELGMLAVFGVVGIAMVQWLYFVAISRTPVGIALLLEFTAPLLVALWVRFVRRQPVHRRVWVALTLVLCGLALVAQVWSGAALDGLGVAAALGAAAALAAYYLLGERRLGRRDAVSVAAWSFLAAGLFWSLLLPWWTFPFDRLSAPVEIRTGGPELAAGVLVVWVVVLGTVVPFALTLLGLQRIGATRAGLLGTIEPPLGALVALAVLAEGLAWVQVLGGLVVLAGIVLVELSRGRPPGATGGRRVSA
jgi:drug/metabolite transporter (DMT)-like permease